MDWRQRLASLVGGSEVRESLQRLPELEVQAQALRYATAMAPFLFTPDRLLSEMDSGSWELLQQYQGYEVLAALGGSGTTDDRMRGIEVQRSRNFFRYDPSASRQIKIWTDFGYGDKIVLTPKDDLGKEDWEAFVDDRANRVLFGTVQGQERSYNLLTDGELFLVIFVSTVDGSMTVRYAKTDQIKEIITVDGDDDTAVWYKRNWTKKGSSQTAYYLDWSFEKAGRDEKSLLPENVQVAEKPGTVVYMMHIKLPGIDMRGWPLLTSSLDWDAAYGEFMRGRLAVTQAMQTYVDKVTAKGGSRALAGIQGLLRSSLATGSGTSERNPAPAPGAEWLQNEMVDRQRLSQSTGGSDAQADGIGFASMAGLGSGTPPHYMNRPDALQNRAVAREMLLPTSKQWQRYQSLWAQVYVDLYELLMRSKGRYAKHRYETDKVTIGRDVPIDVDLDVFMEALTQMLETGLIDQQTAAGIALNRPEFSLDDPEAVLEKMFPPEGEIQPEPLLAQQEYTPEEQVAILEAAARQVAGENGLQEGGPGSGHWGHLGRSGHVGGSMPGMGGGSGARIAGLSPEKAQRVADTIVTLHEKNGGATYNIKNGDLGGKAYFAVSMFPGEGVQIAGKNITREQVLLFMTHHRELLKDERMSLGTWYDEVSGMTYLDLSVTVANRDVAVNLGQKYNQISVFDLMSFNEISTGGDGTEQPGWAIPAGRLNDAAALAD